LNLNNCVAEMDNLLQRVIGEDVHLTAILEKELWSVKVDRAQIEQVIINLAINARDAMPEGGQLTIETTNVVLDSHYAAQHFDTKPGAYVMLAITDTGYGIADDIRPYIFDPFFTTKEVGKGSGLGLAIVFGIAKRFGGSIWPYSETGVGTTFKLYLPRTEEIATSNAISKDDGELPVGNETILLVEDDEDVRKLAKLILQGQGYTLLEAYNGVRALEIMDGRIDDIDLLLTDVIMPGMSGKVLAEKTIEIRPDLKILFMSGYTENAIEQHGILEAGFTLLQKPFSPTILARKVRAMLDTSS
ncbi:MAG: ATP-binding protein, partial [Chloroflexota bacterium]